MAKKKLRYWLNHPTQVDVPLFNELAKCGDIDFKVIYCNWSTDKLTPLDREINLNSGWDFELLKGYPYEIVEPGFFSGVFSLCKECFRCNSTLSIVQGTNSSTFRGVIFAAFLLQKTLMIRYDATLLYYEGSRLKRHLRRLFLPLFFSLNWKLAYTGKWTKDFLKYYKAREANLFWFPYVVDGKWLKKNSSERPTYVTPIPSSLLQSSVVFTVASKISSREAPIDAVKAFAEINNLNTILIIIGDGPEKGEILDFVKNDLKIINRVFFQGYLPYSELARFYGITDVFIHPAHMECWGVSVNEAMSCGIPVIASDMVGSASDLIVQGKTGFTYPVGNIKKLAEIMSKLAGNKELIKTMGSNALELIDDWTPENTANRIVELMVSNFK